MPIKQKIIGTGITQRHVTQVGAPFGPEEVAKVGEFFRQQSTFEGRVGGPIECWSRSVLEQAGLAQPGTDLLDLANLAVGRERPDSREGYAVRLLQNLRILRAVISRGEASEAARFGTEVGALCHEAQMKFKHEKPALRGLSFIEGPRRDRRDALRKVMEEAFEALLGQLGRPPTAKEMLNHLPTGWGQIIQEIVWDDFYESVIHWHSRGQDKETTFKSFQNRLTTIRKKILS